MRSPLLLTLVCATACRHAPVTPPPPPADMLDGAAVTATLTPYLESYGRNWGERRKVSGYVLVSQHDQVLFGQGFGFADRDAKAVPDADTSFRIGSVTKQFTAAAILLLQEDGKLKVTDTVGAYLPEYPAVGAGVTLHQLLTHTGGIPDYTELDEVMSVRDRPITVDALLRSFWDKPLDFEPGTTFKYSNSGYAILGAVIERVSGMTYADFLAKHVFGPANLTRTVVGDAEQLDDRALGYEVDGDEIVPAHAIDLSVAYAAGAVRSTANDLVRWHHALPTILSEASLTALYTPALHDYAYGWMIGDVKGHRMIAHDGGIDGFTTDFLRFPDLDLVIVTWCNTGGVDPGVIAEAAAAAAFGEGLAPIDEPEITALDPAIATRLTGRYALTPASHDAAVTLGVPPDVLDQIATIELTFADGELAMKPAGQPSFPLLALGPTRFLQEQIGATIDVTLPAEGNATAMTITQRVLKLEYARAP